MKKLIFTGIAVLVLISVGFCQPRQPYQRTSRIEFSVWGGFAFGGEGKAGHYSNQWTAPVTHFSLIDEQATLLPQSKNGMSVGVGGGLYLSPHLGVELSLGFIRMNAPQTSEYALVRRDQPTGQEQSDSFDWRGCGTLSILPFSIDFVLRFGSKLVGGYVSLGPTLFLNAYSAETYLGHAVWFSNAVDALKVDLETQTQAWIAPGGNIGAGFVLNVSPMLGATIDVRYFLCPAKSLAWDMRDGVYQGLLNEAARYRLGASDVDAIRNRSGLSIDVAPSFLQVTAGIKMRI